MNFDGFEVELAVRGMICGGGYPEPMSILLVGGGPDTVRTAAIYDRFVADLPRRADGRPPRIAVVLFDRGGSSPSFLPAYAEPLRGRLRCEIIPVPVRAGAPAGQASFDDVDGIVIGGGPTPDYLASLAGCAVRIRAAVLGGVPYLGFSAGAMIAPARALIGGYRIRGVEVCSEECSEGLDELEVRDGLGLVPFAVDVHAAQAGTLSRAVAAVAGGLVDRAAAVDEDTALVLRHPELEDGAVLGSGNCWWIRGTGDATCVTVGTVVTHG